MFFRQFVSTIRSSLRRHRRAGRRVYTESLEVRQLLSAVTVRVPASADTTIYGGESHLSNGGGEYILSGSGMRGLVQFDLQAAGIPEGSTIIDAVLTLNVGAGNGGAAPVSVHRVTTLWGAGSSNAEGDETSGAPAQAFDATWEFASYDKHRWNSAGGDFLGASATESVGGVGTYEFFSNELIDDAQHWLDNSAENFGWLLEVSGAALKSFVSSDSPDPSLAPKLELIYEEPPPPPRLVQGRLWHDLNGDGIQPDLLLTNLKLEIVDGNTWFDVFDGDEYWFKSANDGRWYFLTADGTITRWSGRANELTGDVVGVVDSIFYQQPSLVEKAIGDPEPWLNGWTIELLDPDGTVVQTTTTHDRDINGDGAFDELSEGGWYYFEVLDDLEYTVRQVVPDGWREHVQLSVGSYSSQSHAVGNLNLQFHDSWYENAGGLGEKWLRDPDLGWYFILPNGDLYRWNSQPITNENPLTGELIASVGTEYFDDPHLFVSSPPTLPGDNDVAARVDFGNQQAFLVDGRVWLDFDANGLRDLQVASPEIPPSEILPAGEAWMFDSQSSSWFIIDVDGQPRYWGPHADNSGPPPENTSPVLDSEPWLNGREIRLLNAAGEVVATTTTKSIDLNNDGVIQPEHERGWYQFEDVPPGEYTLETVISDEWLQTAPITQAQTLAAELDYAYDFRTTSSDFRNWGGLNERWLIDRNNTWYYMLSDGSLYRWDVGSQQNNGGLRGVRIATLTPDHYVDLSLLTTPDMSAISVTVSPSSFASSVLFGHHRILDDLFEDS